MTSGSFRWPCKINKHCLVCLSIQLQKIPASCNLFIGFTSGKISAVSSPKSTRSTSRSSTPLNCSSGSTPRRNNQSKRCTSSHLVLGRPLSIFSPSRLALPFFPGHSGHVTELSQLKFLYSEKSIDIQDFHQFHSCTPYPELSRRELFAEISTCRLYLRQYSFNHYQNS